MPHKDSIHTDSAEVAKDNPVTPVYSNCNIEDDENDISASDEFINRLKLRQQALEGLINSGYFLATMSIISFVEFANSIIIFPKSAHFFAIS